MSIINTGKLAGLTIFVTGASRGIGKAIALKAAKDGANVVIAAKTAETNPKLPGTIFSAAKEIEEAGGKALPCVVDVRDENQIRNAVESAVQKFGGIDILINNASAIQLTGTENTDMKRYDLMHSVNTRGTFLVSKLCLPYLRKSSHAHILNLAPPLNMTPHWFAPHVAYTMAKYGMSMCVLGMHEEFRPDNIGVNALWPKTAIYTAAMSMLAGNEAAALCRKPDIMADAAYVILTSDPKTTTGNFYVDEELLQTAGISNFDHYACVPENKDRLMPDFFLSNESLATSAPGAKEMKENYLNKINVKQTGATKSSTSPPTGKVAGLFYKIEQHLSPDLIEKTQCIYQFNVSGEETGTWYLDLKNGSGKCGQGEAPEKPDATLSMDSKQFFDMFTGKTKPATAYMLGKLKIAGNLQKALKLEKLMGKLKAKL